MTSKYSIPADELEQWQNLYDQLFTSNGKESTIENDGSKQLVLLPMLTYTLVSTMLNKLKYLPNSCFNRIVIGKTPICGLRTLNQTSPSLMYRLTEILRTLIDGVRKQHIQNITLIFYKKNHIETIYDSYSIVYDYTIKLSNDENQTSLHTIAEIIYQIEYLFSWNDALPDDVELTFVVSALDQFKKQEKKVPSPFSFLKENMRKVYQENETNHLMGRLTTMNGKIWLKFLPSIRSLSGSSLNSEGLITRRDSFQNDPSQDTTSSSLMIESNIETSAISSPKLKKTTKKTSTPIESNKRGSTLPSLSSISTRNKKKTSFLSAVKSLITPSRTPAPVKSSTPNIDELVLIRNTSTPKPGETASRITIGGNGHAPGLSAIDEVATPVGVRISSPTPSTLTTTDLSTAATPVVAVQRRSIVRGQAAIAREKIAAMQIRDEDEGDEEEEEEDEDDNEQFKKLFGKQRKKKFKDAAVVLTKKTVNLSDVSTISSATSNAAELLFTPPTARKRPTTDRTGDDDLVAEHGTPPKTPRTGRRNRIDDQSSLQPTPMDINDLHVTVDSPRLLRSVTKKLQQQASAKKQLEYEEETTKSDSSKTQETTRDDDNNEEEEEMNRVFVQLERSSIGLHYSMDESD